MSRVKLATSKIHTLDTLQFLPKMADEKKQTKRAAPTAAAPKEKKAKVETAPTRRSARSVSVSEPTPKVSKPAAKAKAEPKVEAKKVEPQPKAEPKAKAEPKKTEKKAEPKAAKKESPKKAAAAPKANAEPKPKAEKVEKKADPKPKEAKKAEPKVAKKATESPKKKAEPKPAAPKVEAKTSPKKSSAMDASPKKASLSKVTEGQQLPPGFTIKANDESMVDLNELSKTTGFIIFFYPKANTPGCTKQACGFRDIYQQIVKAGYQVFGMSADSPNAQTNWKVKNEFPYLLLCDQDGKHLKQFGVFKEPKSVTRSHVIVSKGGVVSQLKIQISPLDSVNEALAFVLKK